MTLCNFIFITVNRPVHTCCNVSCITDISSRFLDEKFVERAAVFTVCSTPQYESAAVPSLWQGPRLKIVTNVEMLVCVVCYVAVCDLLTQLVFGEN